MRKKNNETLRKHSQGSLSSRRKTLEKVRAM